jgi:hypothetical protein
VGERRLRREEERKADNEAGPVLRSKHTVLWRGGKCPAVDQFRQLSLILPGTE